MKNLLFILILFSASLTFAQRDISQNIADFNEVKVYDLITVSLIQSNENKVVVKGNSPESVRIVEGDGVLKVRMAIDEAFDGNSTTVEVYYKSISILDANEGSEIYAKETIQAKDLHLKSQEGGKINVTVNTDNVEIKAVSGGSISVSGKAISQDININSGGIYEGKDLITENTEVSVTAGGSADIFVTDKCSAKVTAGGTVNVYGNPKDLKRKKFAGGNINVVN